MCILQKTQPYYLWKTRDERKTHVCSGNCRGNRSNFRNSKTLPEKGRGTTPAALCNYTQNQFHSPLNTHFLQAKAPLKVSWTTNTAPVEIRQQSCNILIFCSLSTESSTTQHIQKQTKPEAQAGYSLVLGLDIHIKVRLKALGNNAMERIVRDLWLLWLQGNIQNVGSNLPCKTLKEQQGNSTEGFKSLEIL